MKLSEPGSSAQSDRVSASGVPSGNTIPESGVPRPREDASPFGRRSGWLLIGIGFSGLLIAVIVGAFWTGVFRRGGGNPQRVSLPAIPAPYDADRAMRYLIQICDFGPRASGTAAMKDQQLMLQAFFTERGAKVEMQSFEIRHPEDGSPVPMSNLIARWGIDRPKRFLFCAHYDTRPYPDRDRRNPKGTFIGANDGGSGTAALMELSHHLGDIPDDVGVDIVLFDGEEFVWEQGRDEYFIGSKYFARDYTVHPPQVPYQAGVLLDMIGDRELKIYYEQNSLIYAPEVARGIWQTASKLGVDAFVSRSRHRIDDDHMPLNQIAKIPTVDVIDFDYPRAGIGAPSYWHTELDIPENCSGESMAVVVWVVHQWLKQQE